MKCMVTAAAVGMLGFLCPGAVTAQQISGGQGQAGQVRIYSGPIVQSPWYSNAEIRQQLRLNEDQFNRLNTAYNQAWTRYQQGQTELAKSLPADQQAQRMQELRQEFYRSLGAASNDIITDPQTRDRYNQMFLQYRGYDAFYDPLVRERLVLTPNQIQTIGQYSQQWNTSMNDLYRGYETDPKVTIKRYSDLSRRERERMEKILTPQQLQTWRSMTGAVYEFQPSVYFDATSRGPRR